MIDGDLAIRDALSKAIEATVIEFQKYPLDFLSERDIQALLYAELRKLTPELRYSYGANGKNSRFGFKEPFYKEAFYVHPVTTEYYLYNDKRKDRFDVAVLSSKRDDEAAIWRQPCRVGIEIKFWQPGYGGCRYRADITKLQNYHKYLRGKEREFTGIAMLFVHPNIENELVSELHGEEVSSAAYPKDGVALHWVTGWKDGKHHRWVQPS
jgi:hypothetical protein